MYLAFIKFVMQYIFILGGFDGEKCSCDVGIFSPDGASSDHFSPRARGMLSPRDGHASVCTEGNLIAMGGYDGTNYLASVEIYSASSPGAGRYREWTALPGMSTTRAMHAAANIDNGYSSRIFAFGGQVHFHLTPHFRNPTEFVTGAHRHRHRHKHTT